MPERFRKTHLSPPEVTRHIRRAVGDSSIAIKTARSPAVLANQILISGVYDHEDDLIEIKWKTNNQEETVYVKHESNENFFSSHLCQSRSRLHLATGMASRSP